MDRAFAPIQLRLRLELPLEDTLDVFTAARIAQVSPNTMRRWCDLGLFPSWKLVGQWRIDRAPFYEWMRSKHILPEL